VTRHCARPHRARLAWLGLTLALAGCAAAASGVGTGSRNGVLELSWTPPTTKVDGSPMTDVVGYRVYFGTAPGTCPRGGSFFIDAGSSSAPRTQTVTLTLKGLRVGELYYVAVSAVSAAGGESACSAESSARARQAD
jgi:Fibronectin type III domain